MANDVKRVEWDAGYGGSADINTYGELCINDHAAEDLAVIPQSALPSLCRLLYAELTPEERAEVTRE